LIDRDHTIGHAYLISVKSKSDLKQAFENKIIPLLQEYFYGDYGKIGLVLGEGFVKVEEQSDEVFSSFQYDGRESLAHTSYALKSFEDDEFDFDEALQLIFK
jgi:5-methylcytosine-specific restriction protein B